MLSVTSLNINSYNGEIIVQLAENRLAIIDTNINSGMHGEVFVIQFNDHEKIFDLIARYSYVDCFQISTKA